MDEHRNYISKKLRKDYSTYRPDITHQVTFLENIKSHKYILMKSLLAILDSPLNKAGYIDVYIHTEKNVLIHINPVTKIPRTYKRFSKLIGNFLNIIKPYSNSYHFGIFLNILVIYNILEEIMNTLYSK